MDSRSGKKNSLQVAKFGSITGLTTTNFKFQDGTCFLIKNDTTLPITLSVIPGGGTTQVSTSFAPGWNPEIVSEIIKDGAFVGTLLWGY